MFELESGNNPTERKNKHIRLLGSALVLVALLGLNVSAIGLVAIPAGALYLIVELFALILVLNVVYVAVFAILQWRLLYRKMLSIKQKTMIT